LGAEGQGFESLRPDQRKLIDSESDICVSAHASAFSSTHREISDKTLRRSAMPDRDSWWSVYLHRASRFGHRELDRRGRPAPMRDRQAGCGDQRGTCQCVEAVRAPGCNSLRCSDRTLPRDAVNVDISHESLIRQWTPLKQWIEKGARDGATWRLAWIIRVRQHGGTRPCLMRHGLKELEQENMKLKRLVANVSLDNLVSKYFASET
jgi:hypothetical protein